jgi:hypothetical protein
VLDKGSFLATRWQEGETVNLYYLTVAGKSLFVGEYDTPANEIVRAFIYLYPLAR